MATEKRNTTSSSVATHVKQIRYHLPHTTFGYTMLGDGMLQHICCHLSPRDQRWRDHVIGRLTSSASSWADHIVYSCPYMTICDTNSITHPLPHLLIDTWLTHSLQRTPTHPTLSALWMLSHSKCHQLWWKIRFHLLRKAPRESIFRKVCVCYLLWSLGQLLRNHLIGRFL